jgi:hypothetical protein
VLDLTEAECIRDDAEYFNVRCSECMVTLICGL